MNCVNCFLSPFNLIFRAVIFKTLGGVKPKKEKATTNKKREIILYHLIIILSFLFLNNYLYIRKTKFPIATTPVKHPKIKSIFVAIYFNLCSNLFARIAYKAYNVKEPIVEPIEK